MIEELSEYIQRNADTVSSEDIATTVKLAGSALPWMLGIGGLTAGGIAGNLYGTASDSELKTEADTKALLAGLAGLGTGYYVGKNPSLGTPDSASLYAADQSVGAQDMDYIFGR